MLSLDCILTYQNTHEEFTKKIIYSQGSILKDWFTNEYIYTVLINYHITSECKTSQG
jgi:hypothetical protein